MNKYLGVSWALLFSVASFAQSQNSILEAWKGFSDPEIFSSGFTHELSALPLQGSIDIGPRAWSGDYWPSNKGGINYRWNAKIKVGFDYKSPSKEQFSKMSQEELAELAPSEKYDLLMGRYDMPLKSEAASSASKRAPEWAGICHGWAPASIYHNEPTPKSVMNPDGILVPFGSADIKALISYYYAFYHDNGTDQIGLRCFFGSWMGGARGCANDLNAGAFHIVIANKLGLLKEGFLMDVERFREVWNQPVVGFESKIIDANLPPSKKAAKNAVREIRFQTTLFYIDEAESTWNVVHGTKDQLTEKKVYQYRVEINSQNKIIGGEWESDDRPDFLWNVPRAKSEDFGGLLSELPKILND